MRKLGIGFVFSLFLAGCSLSDTDKTTREQILQQQVNAFINEAVQSNWSGLFQLSDGSAGDAGSLQKKLKFSWPDGAVLSGADIASMAWVNEKTAKVKINWSFQGQGAQSYSSETFIWIWRDGTWFYRGRAIR
jgi:hypothetical protein